MHLVSTKLASAFLFTLPALAMLAATPGGGAMAQATAWPSKTNRKVGGRG